MKKRIIVKILVIGTLLSFPTSVCAIDVNSKPVIRTIQNALNDAGFNCGIVDGIAGANTENAIKQYQMEKGLEVTGQINEELLTSLGFKIGTPYGVEITSFVSRYNEAVTHFNEISMQSGDSLINQISEDNITSADLLIDDSSLIFWGLNNAGTYVDSCVLKDNDGIYDVKNLYELCSIIYAMNDYYTGADETLPDVTTLLIDYSIKNNDYTCNVLRLGETAVFSFTYKNPDEEILKVGIPDI